MLGLTVVELVNPVGEYAGRLLADVGCTVIKIEPPGIGSPSRHRPPLWQGEVGLRHLFYNADKKSITLAVNTPTGLNLFYQLLKDADALLITPEMEPFVQTITEIHPRLVVAVLEGFPAVGTLGAMPAEDLLLFAAGGLMYLSGEPDGEPVVAPGEQAFVVGGAQAAFAVLAALRVCRQGGPAQVVRVSYQAALMAQENMVSEYVHKGRPTERTGSQHRMAVPGRIYRCRDGFVHFMVVNSQPQSWQRFVAWMGYPSELMNEAYTDPNYRRAHAEEVDRVVAAQVLDRGRTELVESAQQHHIPCAPVNTVADILRDSHLMERGLVGQAVLPNGTVNSFPARGIRLPSMAVGPIHWAPDLGSDNEEILHQGLGIGPEEWEALLAVGVI